MNIKKTGCLAGAAVIALVIVGFVFLLRGCLAQYDERSKVGQAYLFTKDNKTVVLTLVKFEACNSYSRRGGFVQKSVSTTYYLQCNDARTGEPIKEQELIEQSDLKHYPVEMLGNAAGKAWVFADQLLAYDPVSLTRLADAAEIESKNPSIKGRLPLERQYYRFDPAGKIFFTATDGLEYTLDPSSLAVKAYDENDEPAKKRVSQLKKRKEAAHKKVDSLYEVWRKAGYGNTKEYNRNYSDWSRADSISRVIDDSVRYAEDFYREFQSRMRDLSSSFHSDYSFSYAQINSDTCNGKIYALLDDEEMDRMSGKYFYQSNPGGDKSRRKLYVATLDRSKPVTPFSSSLNITDTPEPVSGAPVFLQGGVLKDRSTGQPLKVSGGFMVLSRDRIGNESSIVFTRMNYDGKQRWSLTLPVKDMTDVLCDGKQLIVFANDNPELSSGSSNLLISIDMENGKAVYYDYMKKAMRGSEQSK